MKTAYELKDGEIIYTPTDEKVASYDGEALRMARGFAEEHKESVEAWIAAGSPETSPKAAETILKTPAEVKETRASRAIPPKPPGSPEAGEKSREVVEWIRQYGTDAEKAKIDRWAQQLNWVDGLPPVTSGTVPDYEKNPLRLPSKG